MSDYFSGFDDFDDEVTIRFDDILASVIAPRTSAQLSDDLAEPRNLSVEIDVWCPPRLAGALSDDDLAAVMPQDGIRSAAWHIASAIALWTLSTVAFAVVVSGLW